jgi:NADPH-dependent 2,4-dienoyl-CoA reductase/sulfur reductase-like enzyme
MDSKGIAMPTYDYLIIGGGMTAEYAVRGIRQVDTSGSIGMIGNEQQTPYKRPPLSKALWKGDPVESIWLSHAHDQSEIHLSRTATRIDVKKKQVSDDRGMLYTYRKLLLATGGRVRKLPFDVEGVIYFRTFDDYQALRRITEQKSRFVVVGGGFTGSEIAAALTMQRKSVTMVFPDDGIGTRVYPHRLSAYINSYFIEKGVRMLTNQGVAGIVREGSEFRVRTTGGEEIVADGVIAGIGMQPNVELARDAGLEIGNGIRVNEFLVSTVPDIYAAGDVADFFSPALGKRMRMEHEDNAKTMGEQAGRNMAGAGEPFNYLPYFYSDLFELGYEAVGQLSSTFEIVEDWKKEFHEGVVYYMEQGKVVGVLLWNTWDQLDNARRLISEKKVYTPEMLKGRLPA